MIARRGLEWSDGAAGPVLGGNWRDEAACGPQTADLFFSPLDADIQRAKAVCAGCPVRPECLADAQASPGTEGVLGGLTEQERAALRRSAQPVRSRRGRHPRPVAAPGPSLAERREQARRNLETGAKACGGPLCKGKVRPLGSFHHMARALDGYQNWCKDCQKANEARRRAEPAGKVLVAA